MLKIKRAYEEKKASDGRRILINRVWPRGVSKSEAEVDEWLKELSPSSELRKWFGHNPDKWPEFRRRYLEELSSSEKKPLLQDLAQEAFRSNVTLVYGAKDTEHSHAKVLEELLSGLMEKTDEHSGR
ncbi:MAG: hypothetical protein CVU64_01065 [Deltaproteobacteria bacterium HGW-Deltaproteobacteria-21]|nr:MAG: hypothetical protein CVU64_01065 [Deltaproteobacteria bacterium HGW-Deltaproteobacteria-21]